MGTWNTRTLNKLGADTEMENEIIRYNMDVVALQEIRWPNFGTKRMRKGTIYYSGRRDGRHNEGTGFYVKEELVKDVLEFEPICSRIARLRIRAQWFKVTLVAVHAPTDVSTDDAKDAWYTKLEEVVRRVPRHDMLLIIGDLNAKLGRNVDAYRGIVGNHSLHAEYTDKGHRLSSFAAQCGMIISSTVFDHKDIHKGTWVSPDGSTINQIDHILVNKKFRSAIQDVRSMRGADCNSDHFLVRTRMKIRLCTKVKKARRMRQFDVEKLEDDAVRNSYEIEIANRFDALQEEHEEVSWEEFKGVF